MSRVANALIAVSLIAVGATGIVAPVQAFAQSPIESKLAVVDSTRKASDPMTSDQARATVQSLVDLAISKVRHEYKGKKNWEKTKKVWAGVKVHREGLKIKTKRRWKEVRHGLQTDYRVRFPGEDTSRPPVRVHVRSVTQTPESEESRAGWQMVCDMATPLDFSARIERWNLGVRWYSVEVSGHMDIRMELQGRLSSYPDYADIPPAIVIDPKVTSATLHLDALYVDRVSKVGGEVAEQWGELVEKIIREIFLEDLNGKLPEKLNRSIDKKRDELRFSVSDWLAGLAPQ